MHASSWSQPCTHSWLPTSHRAMYPQLQDMSSIPPAPSLPHHPTGDTGLPALWEGARPLGGDPMGSRAPCQPAQGTAGANSPSQAPLPPWWRSSTHWLVPVRRKEHRPANPLSVPAVPTWSTVLCGARHWPHSPESGFLGQHSHCQAQPCLLHGHMPPSLGGLGR